VYGAVVCSCDAVSLLYLELYVKLSIYLSTLNANQKSTGRAQPPSFLKSGSDDSSQCQ
jgi:hypothetical protein